MASDPNQEIVTRDLDGDTWHFVSFSPRGFSNELATVAFMELENAEEAVSEISNDVNQWLVTGADARRMASHYDRVTVVYVWSYAEQFPAESDPR